MGVPLLCAPKQKLRVKVVLDDKMFKSVASETGRNKTRLSLSALPFSMVLKLRAGVEQLQDKKERKKGL